MVVHESVDESPFTMEAGAALNVHVGAFGGGGFTVMSTEQCTEPPAPVAVSTYVSFAAGATLCEPFVATAPIP